MSESELTARMTKLLYETDGTAEHVLEAAPSYGVVIRSPSHPLPSEPDLAALREALVEIADLSPNWMEPDAVGESERRKSAIARAALAALAAANPPEPARDGLDVEALRSAFTWHLLIERGPDGTQAHRCNELCAPGLLAALDRLAPDRDAPREPA